MDNLAEDYAATKGTYVCMYCVPLNLSLNGSGWCNFSHPAAEILPLTKVDKAAYSAFRQPPVVRADDISPFYISGLSEIIDVTI